MLLMKDRVIYQVNKLYIANHIGDNDAYAIMVDTMSKESVSLYTHDAKNVIDFIFDAIVAELNVSPEKIVDVNYIVNNAYE